MSEIDDVNLLEFVSTSPDEETKALLESYISCREKSKGIQNKKGSADLARSITNEIEKAQDMGLFYS